jgi:hypothetical protein
METLSLAFLGHLVGDYLLQNDWMAQHKKSSNLVCMLHSAIWSASIAFFTGWGWLPFLILFGFHFVQDRTNFIRFWMRIAGQEKFATGALSPWSIILTDNIFHFLQIWLVWKFLV